MVAQKYFLGQYVQDVWFWPKMFISMYHMTRWSIQKFVVDSLVDSFLTHSVVALLVSLSPGLWSFPILSPLSLSLCFLTALHIIGINVKSKSRKIFLEFKESIIEKNHFNQPLIGKPQATVVTALHTAKPQKIKHLFACEYKRVLFMLWGVCWVTWPWCHGVIAWWGEGCRQWDNRTGSQR